MAKRSRTVLSRFVSAAATTGGEQSQRVVEAERQADQHKGRLTARGLATGRIGAGRGSLRRTKADVVILTAGRGNPSGIVPATSLCASIILTV
jgi:hypothetical protein